MLMERVTHDSNTTLVSHQTAPVCLLFFPDSCGSKVGQILSLGKDGGNQLWVLHMHLEMLCLKTLKIQIKHINCFRDL